MKKKSLIVLTGLSLMLSSCGSVAESSHSKQNEQAPANADDIDVLKEENGQTPAYADDVDTSEGLNGQTEGDVIHKIEGIWVGISYNKNSLQEYTLHEFYFDGEDSVRSTAYDLSSVRGHGIKNVIQYSEEGTYYVNDEKFIHVQYTDLSYDFDYPNNDGDVLEQVTYRGRWDYHRIDSKFLDELIEDLREEGTDIIEEKYSDFVYDVS